MFEPSDFAQDKLRELGRSSKVSAPPLQKGQTGRQWFWVLLPKQKDLAARGRTPETSEIGKDAPSQRSATGMPTRHHKIMYISS
ncbi:MAG: hypothetical protein NPIRA03_26380 [Nitrospirales bacterium]|nr:MAG: hypothetical protein NPIRA03_26380 [Nitrospirales bacterium]